MASLADVVIALHYPGSRGSTSTHRWHWDLETQSAKTPLYPMGGHIRNVVPISMMPIEAGPFLRRSRNPLTRHATARHHAALSSTPRRFNLSTPP